MGGNNLNVPSVRLDKYNYESLVQSMSKMFPTGNVIPSYNNKPSFGDLDFLYPDNIPYVDPTVVVNTFESYGLKMSQAPVVNGSVTSYGVVFPWNGDVFQIDFVGVPESSYGFAYNYFSYNDMGNLLGRVARKMKVKLGHLGLFYTQRSPQNDSVVLKEHLLTRNWDTALDYLGYDAKRHLYGFNELEDVFEYVVSSPYYDFNKFDLTLRNHRSRIRDAKRPNYRAFLEWAKHHPKEFVGQEGDFLGKAFNYFPDFELDYFACLNEHVLHMEYKMKYNGEIVRNVTGLEGKALGQFMAGSVDLFSQEFVLGASQEEIENLIFYKFCSETL